MNKFIDRFSVAFGKAQGLMLKFTGLMGGEVAAEGVWVTDHTGERWLDFGSFGIHLLGHLHPEIIEVAQQQLRSMGLSTRILGNEVSTRCAEALLKTLPASLTKVVFGNSGAEVVENALKMAVLSTGSRKFIAFKNSYHGKTLGALCISDSLKKYKQLNQSLDVQFVEIGDADMVESLLATGEVAAVIIEPVQGEGGIVPVAPDFLATLAQLTKKHNALFVLDEIQTGLGRCGEVWQGISAACVPDILLVGKTLGGGIVPIAAAVFSSERIGAKASDPLLHASSFAGGAFACCIAEKVIDIVSDGSFLAQVRKIGQFCKLYLKEELKNMATVADVRGEGLMLGIEFTSSSITSDVIIEAAKRRLLLTFCLNKPEVLRFYPPATISEQDLILGLDKLVCSIRAVS